jgi:hypothetical protein
MLKEIIKFERNNKEGLAKQTSKTLSNNQKFTMMKSIALNAVILYILFKSSVKDIIQAKLPDFLQRL